MNDIENALFYISRMTLGGMSVSYEYGEFDTYENDEKFRNRIFSKMNYISRAGIIIVSSVRLIMKKYAEIKNRIYIIKE